MPTAARTSRTHTWLEGLGDWAWPGEARAAAVELQPPPWVPTLPRGFELAVAAPTAPAPPLPRAGLVRRWAPGTLLAGLAVASIALAVDGRVALERLVGVDAGPRGDAVAISATASPQPALTFVSDSRDAAGSSIDSASYASTALHGSGALLVYLPPGYADTSRRYPVIYLLHGTDQSDSSFLQIGVQRTLDRLIAAHQMPPTIAVMIQGGAGTNNWLNQGSRGYESYVLEVQRLIDRTLPTIPDRAARAIAGYSMGGFGAMHLALSHPDSFSVAESWLGFFNGLEGLAKRDSQALSRLGLQAFLYGGASDAVADPSENAPFAAQLRAAGAEAHSAVYPGEHDFATLEAHLQSTLAFAGRALQRGSEQQTGAGLARPAGGER